VGDGWQRWATEDYKAIQQEKKQAENLVATIFLNFQTALPSSRPSFTHELYSILKFKNLVLKDCALPIGRYPVQCGIATKTPG